ncbi:response regulator [Mucilaginibacter sp. BT774]|uniref:response regulator n=1 Tax=Mucilaginibacter sp. BT774 TaxID=3062276 RepID=UPI002675AC1C|nr:response regulator [Mucilaginibacter sp. BT774]MDO3627632.1 response regulator [Mucilaginibacter sp. BT774]
METILIQETDAATLDVVGTALQRRGFRVYNLTDRRENILEMIQRHHPRLIFLDCWLSHYTGKEIIHWIKAHFPRLPVIAFSCDNRIEQGYRELGFDGYLKKPFDLEALYRVIRKFLSGRRKRHQVGEPV